jgi:general secretion pathway protein F
MQFFINAIDANQQVVTLTVDAASELAARDAARARGLIVLSLRARGLAFSFAQRRRSRFPATLFSIELMALLEAGLNLVEALQTLCEKEAQGERRVVLSGIVDALHRGESFSRAVGRFPQYFSPLYVATLRASEQTGDVGEALSRYIAYQEEIDRVRGKIVAAAIYPAILLTVGTLVLAFLVFYVVPRFARVYENMAGDLPFFSVLLLALGQSIEQHGWLIALVTLCLAAAAIYGACQAGVRAWFHERLWRLPVLGERMRIYQLARLYRTVGMLLRAGIPVVRALDMVRDLLSGHLRASLARARGLIEAGQPLSSALSATGLATAVAARMMAVGERSGNMGEMMGRIARFHDDETARFVEWFTRAFEPLLMAVLGLAVGGVVVLMYMPIFELAGSIQ